MKKIVIIGIMGLMTILSAEEAAGPLKQERVQLMEKHKALESQSHQERIKILQQAEDCIKLASTPQAYKECEKREQEARKAFKEQQKPKREALREEHKALKEKAVKLREERMNKQEYPKGTIATH